MRRIVCVCILSLPAIPVVAREDVAATIAKLDSLYREEREESARSLAEAGESAGESLRAIGLRHPAARVREACARLLGRLPSAAAARDLAETMTDVDPSVRHAARESLLRIAQTLTTPETEALLMPEIRAAAADLGSDDAETSRNAEASLRACGRPAVPVLLEALDRPAPSSVEGLPPDARRATLRILEEIRDPRTAAGLVPRLSDPDPDFRERVRFALAGLGPEADAAVADAERRGALPGGEAGRYRAVRMKLAVERILREQDAASEGGGYCAGQFREIVALGPGAIEILSRMVIAPDDYAFGREGSPGLDESLVHLATSALADFDDPAVIPVLRKRLEAQPGDPEVRIALHRRGDRGPAEEYRREIEKNLGMLRAAGPSHRKQAHRAMLEMGTLEIKLGELDRAETILREVLAEGPAGGAVTESPYGSAWYNLACVLARRDRRDEAIDALEKAVRAGAATDAWLKRDRDLDGIRNDPRFDALVRRARPPEGREPLPSQK